MGDYGQRESGQNTRCCVCQPASQPGLCGQSPRSRAAGQPCSLEHAAPHPSTRGEEAPGCSVEGMRGRGEEGMRAVNFGNGDPRPPVEKLQTPTPCPDFAAAAGSHGMDTKPIPQRTSIPAADQHVTQNNSGGTYAARQEYLGSPHAGWPIDSIGSPYAGKRPIP